ncbi:MAG: hypothetical protein U9Q76_08460 [candidate division WOR-3 bacterium]|nr:hypothetical protein [candidate division WOR-3 bacterium]
MLVLTSKEKERIQLSREIIFEERNTQAKQKEKKRRIYRSKLAVEISVKVSELGTFPSISTIPKTYLDLLHPSNKGKGRYFLFKDDADIDYLCVDLYCDPLGLDTVDV